MLGKIEGRRGRGWKRMKWLHDIIGSMDMSVSKLWQSVKDCLACCSPRGHKEWDASQQPNNNIQQANCIYGVGFSSAWLVWASTVWFYSLCKNALPWEHPTDKAHRGKLFGSSSHSYRKAKPGQHSSLVIQISLPFPNKRLPGGSDSKESACNAGDTGLIHGVGSPGEGNGNPLQYSSLENPMDREAWLATVHGVANSCTGLSN